MKRIWQLVDRETAEPEANFGTASQSQKPAATKNFMAGLVAIVSYHGVNLSCSAQYAPQRYRR